MLPPRPAIPTQGTSTSAPQPRRGVGIVDHIEHHEHARQRDSERLDKSNMRALHYAVEARKPDDTDEAIVERAGKFRAFLISTGTK